MTLALLRRDPVLRSFPPWGILAFLSTSLLFGLLLTISAARHAAPPAWSFVAVGWISIAIYLGLVASTPRCATLDLALPISARQLWLVHVGTLILCATALAAGFVVLVGTSALPRQGPPPAFRDLAGLALALESGLVLATVLLESPRLPLARIAISARRVAEIAAVLLGVLVLLVAITPAGPAGALVPAVPAAILGVLAWRRVPGAFAIAPREPGAAVAAGAPFAREDAPARGTLRAGTAVWFQVFRSLTAGPKEMFVYPFIVFLGFFLGDVFEVSKIGAETRDLRFVYIPLATYMLFSFVPPRLARLHGLDPLPVSRRLIFAGLVLPSALVFAASYAAGAFLASTYGEPVEYVDFSKNEGDETWSVSIPLRAWEISWDGSVPDVRAPWGESHPAERIPLSRGGRAVAWNPYGTPAGSSSRFVALQISRGAAAVYGAAIPPGEIEPALETRSDGAVVGRGPTLGLRTRNPDLSPRTDPLFPVMMALVGVPWLLLMAGLHRTYRPGVTERVRVGVFWAVVAAFVLTMLIEAAGLVTGLARPWVVRAFVEIPTWKLGGSALGSFAVWLAAALLSYGAYRTAEAQFLRSEIPVKPSAFSLLERARSRTA